MKGIFVVLSGVSDEPCKTLGQITPLQSAKTPNLDKIAGRSRIDYCFPTKEGVIPESSSAMVSLFGRNPNFVPRGILEAIGSGISLKPGDLALRTNFATIDGLDSRNVLDRRAGRTLMKREARMLARAINQKVKLPFKFEFRPTLQHRGVLVIRGGFSDNITNIDPGHGGVGMVLKNFSNKVNFSKPLDDEEESKISSKVVNDFVMQSHEILDKHPLNVARAKKGLYSANFLLCRGAGTEIPKTKKLKGDWMALACNPLDIGIAKSLGMDVYRINYPPLRGMDIYSNVHAGLRKSIKSAIKMLKKYKDKHDYFYISFRETNTPGLDNKPLEKRKMIETLDKKFFSFLRGFARKNKVRLLITSDHTTSCRQKSQTDIPVPVLLYPDPEKKIEEKRFTEDQGFHGKKILGNKLLEKTLFASKL